MASSTLSESVQDTELNANVKPPHTEHFFNRRGRSGGPREVWTRQSQLGRGGFGTVWLETCQQLYRAGTPSTRAVKEIRIQPGNPSDLNYNRELEAFAKFSQPKFEPYFVRSHGWYRTDTAVFITMAYHPLGDLQQYLSQPLPEAEARLIAEQVLEGLRHMHDNGFAHRDLKPKNILIASQGPDWRVQITDFGITKKIQDGQTGQFTMGQGTNGYMAPEMIISTLKGSAYALDMWSLGSMTYYMLTNRVPVRDLLDLHRYGTGATDSIADDYSPATVTQNAQAFISKLLARNPQNRPSADEALSTKWMNGIHVASGSLGEVQSVQEAFGALDVGDGRTTGSGGGYASYAPSNTWSSIPEPTNAAVSAARGKASQLSYAPSGTWNSIPTTRDTIVPAPGTASGKRMESESTAEPTATPSPMLGFSNNMVSGKQQTHSPTLYHWEDEYNDVRARWLRREEERSGVANVPEEPDTEMGEHSGVSNERPTDFDLDKPVYLKGLFSVSTTSSKAVSQIRADIKRVLNGLGVEYTEIKGGFSCRHSPTIDLKNVADIPTSPLQTPDHRRRSSFGLRPGGSPRTPDRWPTEDSDSDASEDSAAEMENGGPSKLTAAGETSTHVRSDMGGSLVLEFEIFIVKVPLFTLHGIQFKKMSGDSWQYKNMADRILRDLRL